MHTPNYLATALGAIAILLTTVGWAGPVTIRTPDGGKVQIYVEYRDGSTATASTLDNGGGDEDGRPGTFTFTVPDEANATRIDLKNLGAIAGLPAYTSMDFGVAGLLSFEPVDLWAFSSTDTAKVLVAVIDVLSFISGGDSFSEGEVLSAEDGVVPGVNGIVFHDASSLFLGGVPGFFDVPIDFDPFILEFMPLYSGGVSVEPAIEFRIGIPEPPPLALLIPGIVAAALLARSRSRQYPR